MNLRIRTCTHRQPRSRRGFTLIELLVVIVIIGILMGLIIPAVMRAQSQVRMTAVSTEISQLDQAIATFKGRFGIEPPSSLTIPVIATGWTAENRQKVLRVWDQFDFATCGGLGATASTPGVYPAAAVNLNGAECLVFFLGGLNSNPSGPAKLVGFSKNPRTPWSTVGENRDGPFYDRFDIDRLVDIDGDGAVEFLDSLPDQVLPLLYFSSQGKNYRKTNSATAWDDFDVNGGMTNAADMSMIYVGADNKTPERAQGFQIVSPGPDGVYGVGGMYTDGSELTAARSVEGDNITNFSGGPLKK